MKKVIIVCISLVILIVIISNISDNELDGKTIAFLGDSLMSGQGNSDRSFEYYFQNLVPNSKLINNSKSGATIANNTGTGNMIILYQDFLSSFLLDLILSYYLYQYYLQ